jgi:uncharacterized membrane protein YgcG
MEHWRVAQNFRLITLGFVGACLTSCGPPGFEMIGNNVSSEGKDGPPVELFIRHLRCEAYRTILDAYTHREKDQETWNTVRYLYWYGYQAAGQLTLDVTRGEGFNPSLSYIDPFAAVMTNFTLTLNGQLSGIQHRNIQENITIDYSKLFDRTGIKTDPNIPDIVPVGQVLNKNGTAQFPNNQFNLVEQCAQSNGSGSGIQGDLGLADTVVLGLGAFREQDAVVAPGFAGGPGNVGANVFGSTIDFTFSMGLNVGPNWTLTHFKGPTGGGGGGGSSGNGSSGSGSGSTGTSGGSGGINQGLLAGNRTAKDTLLISFSPACRQPDFPAPSAKAPSWETKLPACPMVPSRTAVEQTRPTDEQRAEALKGATINNTQILLQNIIPSFLLP